LDYLGESELVKFMPTVLQQAIKQLLPPHQMPIQPLLILWRKKQGEFSYLKNVNDKLLNSFF